MGGEKAVAVHLIRLLRNFLSGTYLRMYPITKNPLGWFSGYFTGYPCSGEGVRCSRRQHSVDCKGGGCATPQPDATTQGRFSVGWVWGRKGWGAVGRVFSRFGHAISFALMEDEGRAYSDGATITLVHCSEQGTMELKKPLQRLPFNTVHKTQRESRGLVKLAWLSLRA